MAAEKHLNAAGTHVWLLNPETGGLWECPIGVAHTYAGEPGPGVRGGWEYAEPRDDSLEGLFDEVAEKPKRNRKPTTGE